MPGAYLYGWDIASSTWVKLQCNAAGKLIIDPSEIFEEVPTDGEAGKAPTSNWAHDHKADASAHHTRYTDTESRAAIGNLLDSTGCLLKNFNCSYLKLSNILQFWMKASASSTRSITISTSNNYDGIMIESLISGGGYGNAFIMLYTGGIYTKVATEYVVDSKILTHKNIANAHHAVYTDAMARAAINDLLDSTGVLLKNLGCNFFNIGDLKYLILKYSAASNYQIELWSDSSYAGLRIGCTQSGVGYVPMYIDIFNGTTYDRVATEGVVDSKIATHKGDASAHHTRYTDAEAIAAVGYNGTKYWSCPGIHFDCTPPASDFLIKSDGGYVRVTGDGIYLVAHVSLPHGAVVTSVIVNGNAAASAETWTLDRRKVSDLTGGAMASAAINTADTSITNPTIDNSLYSYFLYTSSLDTDDEVWGAIITYTV